MDSYQFNKGKTTRAHIGAVVGITLGAAALISVIAIAASGAYYIPK
jgi:hypothetical protein